MNNNISNNNFLYKKFKHDLKNPINAMIGYSEYILEEIDSDEYIIHINDINSISKTCKFINDKIEQLLVTNSSVGEFLDIDNLQFELRSLLCSVIGLIEIINDKTEVDNEENEFIDCVDKIYLSCKSMLGIVENIKTYIKVDQTKQKIDGLDSLPQHDYKLMHERIDTIQYKGKILIIDDDPLNSELMDKILSKIHHEITTANNAKDALKEIRSSKFDLVLLDIIMPDVNGIELLQKIKKNNDYYETPIIMLSALDDLNSIVDCINLGAADYITKPIDKVLLQARINNCLERKEYRDKEKKYLNKIKEEEKKNNDLLLNIMPASIAERLKSGESNIADRFSNVSVLFADISGFTQYSSNISPKVIVEKLNDIFSVFDDLVDKYNVEKIKTIGDNYMIASGIPHENRMHAETIIDIALEMNKILPKVDSSLSIKIGISSGEVVAGVIGKRKFIYDLWGDTVNVASRMEKYGKDNKIHISNETYKLIKNKYKFSEKNILDIKGKGKMETYFLLSKS